MLTNTWSVLLRTNQQIIAFNEKRFIFHNFSPTEPSENYHPKLRSVAVVAVAVAEAVANWESRLRRQKQ